MTVTEQLPDDSVQVVEENVTLPVPETLDHVTIPVGEGYPPDTVAVQVIGVPMPKDDSVHDNAIIVGAFVMVSLAVRELP